MPDAKFYDSVARSFQLNQPQPPTKNGEKGNLAMLLKDVPEILDNATADGSLADRLFRLDLGFAPSDPGEQLVRWIEAHPTDFRAAVPDVPAFFQQWLDSPAFSRAAVMSPTLLRMIEDDQARGIYVHAICLKHGPPRIDWVKVALEAGVSRGRIVYIIQQRLFMTQTDEELERLGIPLEESYVRSFLTDGNGRHEPLLKPSLRLISQSKGNLTRISRSDPVPLLGPLPTQLPWLPPDNEWGAFDNEESFLLALRYCAERSPNSVLAHRKKLGWMLTAETVELVCDEAASHMRDLRGLTWEDLADLPPWTRLEIAKRLQPHIDCLTLNIRFFLHATLDVDRPTDDWLPRFKHFCEKLPPINLYQVASLVRQERGALPPWVEVYLTQRLTAANLIAGRLVMGAYRRGTKDIPQLELRINTPRRCILVKSVFQRDYTPQADDLVLARLDPNQEPLAWKQLRGGPVPVYRVNFIPGLPPPETDSFAEDDRRHP